MKDVEIYFSYTADIPLWGIYLVLLGLIVFFIVSILYVAKYKEVKGTLEECEEHYKREIKRKERLIVDYQEKLKKLRELATRPKSTTNSTIGNKEEKPRANNGRFKAKG